jgi:hypothetical protein
MFDDFEKLGIENESSNCLDVEDIGCLKNLSLPLYLNDDENYDDEEVIDDLDKIIDEVATGSNMSIISSKNHSFQESQSNACENSQTQIFSQNNNSLENTLPESKSDNSLNASGKIYNFFSRNTDLVVSADEKEFEKSIELELNKFISSNDSSYSFQEGLSRKQRCIIHSVSEKLNLFHQSQCISPARFIIVSKIGVVVGEKTTRKLIIISFLVVFSIST